MFNNMDSDEEIDVPSYNGILGNIILINAFDPLNHGTEKIAYAATNRLLKQYLRQSDSHHIAVCYYGIENSPASNLDSKNIVDIFSLGAPNLVDYKKFQNFNVTSYDQVKQFELSEVLWHCSKMFARCKKQLSSQTILMLTRLDIAPTTTDQRKTLEKVRDLIDSNIDLRIINVSKEKYQVDPFYEKFFKEATGTDILPKEIWDVKAIETLMHQQSQRHLAVAKLNFEIGNELAIGVGLYSLIKSSGQTQPKQVNLDRNTNALVTSVTRKLKINADTPSNEQSPMDVDNSEHEPNQMPLLEPEILHYQVYGGERVEFTDDEKKALRNPFGPPMLKLLGFKPSHILCKEKWFLKSCYFLFPNEGIIEGSTVAFKALHKACADMEVVAICVLCTRVNARPKIVALSPCTHPLGLDVEMGFDVIQIPFVENVRDLSAVEKDESLEISQANKSVMKDTLNSLKFDYKSDMFENPKLQSQYRAIEAIALEEDLETFVDTTKPDSSKFKDLNEDLFEEIFGPFGKVAAKRTNDSNTSSNKRVKAEKNDNFDEDLLQSRITNQTVHQYTVPQLKEVLKHKHIPDLPALTGLNKKRLVELVYEHFG